MRASRRAARFVSRLSARIAALAAFVILVAAASAGAAETLPTEAPAGSPVVPNEFSAADQYVESVPTSRGPRPAKDGNRRHGGGGDPLPVPPAVANLDPTLKEVATSPKLGAPDRALHDANATEPSVPAAAVSALDDGDGGRLLWLLLAIVAISAAIAGTATYRHRTRRATSV
jgi:hypothetical protein